MITKNKAFKMTCSLLAIILMLGVIIPFWLLIISSFTPEDDLVKNGYALFPKRLSISTYTYLWGVRHGVLRALFMSVVVAAIGVTTNVTFTVLYAYPLSRRNFPARRFFSLFLFFTMLFNGGLVPTYMVYTRIFGIADTLWGMIIPGLLLSPFNVILVRTYIKTNISDEIVEAARIDGCTETRVLFRIVFPLSKPIIGTISLMAFITYWNNWTNGIYYLQQRTDLQGIQNYLKRILDSVTSLSQEISQGLTFNIRDIPSVGIRMALAVIGILPILIVFPFFQKNFVKGITVGSVKG